MARVVGDVAEFLQGLVTNDVTGRLPVWAGLLTPQGKALFDFIIWPSDNDLLLDCEAEAADALVKRLRSIGLRRRIAITRDDRPRPCTGAPRGRRRRRRPAASMLGRALARPRRSIR
jgi:folate-binding Fe-S cluster repair protein YgfZ